LEIPVFGLATKSHPRIKVTATLVETADGERPAKGPTREDGSDDDDDDDDGDGDGGGGGSAEAARYQAGDKIAVDARFEVPDAMKNLVRSELDYQRLTDFGFFRWNGLVPKNGEDDVFSVARTLNVMNMRPRNSVLKAAGVRDCRSLWLATPDEEATGWEEEENLYRYQLIGYFAAGSVVLLDNDDIQDFSSFLVWTLAKTGAGKTVIQKNFTEGPVVLPEIDEVLGDLAPTDVNPWAKFYTMPGNFNIILVGQE
jgi:hypothetical protein